MILLVAFNSEGGGYLNNEGSSCSSGRRVFRGSNSSNGRRVSRGSSSSSSFGGGSPARSLSCRQLKLSSSSGLLRPRDGGHFPRSLLLWIQSVFFMLNKIHA